MHGFKSPLDIPSGQQLDKCKDLKITRRISCGVVALFYYSLLRCVILYIYYANFYYSAALMHRCILLVHYRARAFICSFWMSAALVNKLRHFVHHVALVKSLTLDILFIHKHYFILNTS